MWSSPREKNPQPLKDSVNYDTMHAKLASIRRLEKKKEKKRRKKEEEKDFLILRANLSDLQQQFVKKIT